MSPAGTNTSSPTRPSSPPSPVPAAPVQSLPARLLQNPLPQRRRKMTMMMTPLPMTMRRTPRQRDSKLNVSPHTTQRRLTSPRLSPKYVIFHTPPIPFVLTLRRAVCCDPRGQALGRRNRHGWPREICPFHRTARSRMG